MWDLERGCGRDVGEGDDVASTVERGEEEVVSDTEPDGGADADFAGYEEGQPEGELAGGEVDEGRAPVGVEDGRRDDDVPHGGDDDGGEGGLGDPEECRAQLEDRQDDDAAGDDAVGWGFHARV